MLSSNGLKKEFFFRDQSFLRNFGFDGEKGYLIDVGDFYKREDLEKEEAFFQSVQGTMHPVRVWLAKEDPQSLQFLEETLVMRCDKQIRRKYTRSS